MSLFRPAKNAPERRDLLSSAWIPRNSDGYGNHSGRIVTTDTALRLGAVYACVGLIADALSTTPIDVYRKSPDGQRVPLDTPPLLRTPSGSMVLVEWLFPFFSSLLLRGNTFGYKDNFDELGYPREVLLIHPYDASVTRRSRYDPEVVYRFNGAEVPPERVLHVKGFTLPGDLLGLSPIAYHAQMIGMGLAASDFGAQFYVNGGQPTAVLQSDMPVNKEQADILKERVLSVIRGKREPIVLGGGAKWTPISVPPAESQFLETMRYSVNDVARIFHVPAEKIGGTVEGGTVTYANREANVIEFQTDALLPNAVRFEQHISRLLPNRQYAKFNMDAAIRVDLKTRYEAHQIGIQSKFLLPDEARELEDRLPLTAAQKEELNPPVAVPAMPAAEGGTNG